MKYTLLVLTLLFFISYSKAQQPSYFPPTTGNDWETLALDELNWCSDKVDSLYQFLADIDSRSFLLVKDGKIALEQYFGSYTADSTSAWFSAAKSFRAVLIGKAQEDGYLDIDDPVSDYLGSGWTSLSSAQEDSITIKHLLTMTSGLDDSNFLCGTLACLSYVAPAGTRWSYHNGSYGLTKDIIETITGRNHNVYSNTIENQIGMDGFWLTLFGISTYYSTARDMARFGLLVNNNGIWDDETILADTDYLNAMVTPSQTLNPSYGYLWWLNGQSQFVTTGTPTVISGSIAPDAPVDIRLAAGSGGQFISISPSENMIMIRQASSENANLTGLETHNEIWKQIMNLECTVSDVSDVQEANTLKVYPNPTDDFITLDIQGEGKHELSIFNTIGIPVLQTYVENGEAVNIKNLEAGLYFIMIDQTSSSKFIVK